MANRVGIEIEVNEKGAVRSLKTLGKASDQTAKEITDSSEKASTGISSIATASNAAKLSVVALGAATIKFASDFISAGLETTKQAEKVETQFETLLGSAQAAQERYGELAKFAASTPFELNSVANASKILQTLTNGFLATGEGLRSVGDAAAIAGVKFDELAVTVGRAYSGLQSNRAIGESLARLQELGLISGKARTKIEELQKASKGQEAWKVLQENLDKTKGGMEALSETLEGRTSTLVDNIGLLAAGILEATGATDALKSSISGLNDIVNEGIKSQETDKALKKDIKNLTLSQIDLLKDYNREKLKQIADADRFNTLTQEEARLLQGGFVNYQQIIEQRGKNRSSLLAELKALTQRETALKNFAAEDDKRAKAETARIEEEKRAKEAAAAQEVFDIKRALEVEKVLIDLRDEQEEIRKERARQKIEDRQKEIESLNNLRLLEEISGLKGFEKEIVLLEQRKNKRLELAEETFTKESELAEAKLIIEKDYANKLKKIDEDVNNQKIKNALLFASTAIKSLEEIFGENKAFQSANVIVNTASGIQRSFADLPPPLNFIQAGLIGASGIAQLAKINSANFAEGGLIQGAGSGTSDSVPINASAGEFVVKESATTQNLDLLESINSGEPVAQAVGEKIVIITDPFTTEEEMSIKIGKIIDYGKEIGVI